MELGIQAAVQLVAWGALCTAGALVARSRKEPQLRQTGTTDGVDNALLALLSKYDGRFGYACRRRFGLNFNVATHLNHGSFGAAPRVVAAAVAKHAATVEEWPDEFFRRQASRRYREVADVVALQFGAPVGSVALVVNATEGVNSVLRSLRLSAGEAILISDNTYRACANAVRDAAERRGAHVVEMRFQLPAASPRALAAAFEAALDAHPEVRVALVDHITSPTGLVMPVHAMVAAAHARGVRVLIDGAHAPVQLPLDLAALDADWYTGNLHKWAFAAKGCAFLYTAPRLAAPADIQGLAVSHFWQSDYVTRFFMQGTSDFSRYLSIPTAFEFLDSIGGAARVREYNAALVRVGAQICASAWGTRPLCDPLPMPTGAADADLCAPFLVAVESPIDYRTFVRPPLAADIDEAAAVAAAWADSGLNERVAQAVLDGWAVQSQFVFWPVTAPGGGVRGALFCRLSAQIYNVPEDYRKLSEAVRALAAGASR